MTSDPPQHSLRTHPGGHRVFAQTVRYLLAPVTFLCSGFFTTNFFISGQYTWPRSSRALALTLTLLVLSYEFVYKEQVATTGSGQEGRRAVLYACVIPYAVGALLMLTLWKQ